MIIDSLENLSLYNSIPKNVIDFIKGLSPEKEVGCYKIDDRAYANIETYETKSIKDCKFEAHKKYVDIQMLLSGVEELDYISIKELTISDEYNESKDIMFFENPMKPVDRVILESGKFALIYPHEAHRPQIALYDKSINVKKVVVKILV